MARIAFVSNSARGEYTGRLRWARALAGRGYDMTFILPRGEDDYAGRIEREGVPVLRYRLDRASLAPHREIRAIADLVRLFRAHRFEIVHSFGHKANVYATLAASVARKPIIFHHVTGLGEPFINAGTDWRRRAIRAALLAFYCAAGPRLAGVFFQNPDDERLFSFLPESKRILTRGTGVDPGEFSPESVPPAARDALRRELGLGEGQIVVTFVGRLLADKGLFELLAAARSIAGRREGVVFLFVGNLDRGNARSLREADVRGFVTNGPIRFIGRRDDVKEILAITDVFVNPSYREGMPRTNVEAMAMARPLVTTDVPGCRETVEHGASGLLVLPRDARALEEAIERLLASPELRARMGAQGQARAERLFSIANAVCPVVDAYHAALRGG